MRRSSLFVSLSLAAVGVFANIGAAIGGTTAVPIPVSGDSPFTAGCEGVPQSGHNYLNAEVEPRVAADPTDPQHLVAVYQQDRWSNGAARGLMTAISHDGGETWSRSFAPFTSCSGARPGSAGAYERASDPWVAFAPDGTVYQVALSFNDSNTAYAILVSTSHDGGATWSEPTVLDRAQPYSWAIFDDKESITADPRNAQDVYAVWDHSVLPAAPANPDAPLSAWPSGRSEAVLSRTSDGGANWSSPQVIWKPPAGKNEFTIGNLVAVLPNHDLVDIMLHQKNGRGTERSASDVSVVRSTDGGSSWSQRIVVSDVQGVPVTDPDTGQAVRTSAGSPDVAVNQVTGALYAVWQDARFSWPPTGHSYAGIAFSQSLDGGRTWSTPLQLNQAPASEAFNPSIDVAADGTVGVTYYDFRNNTPAAGLPTDSWLVHCAASCTDPGSWSEQHVSGPFDLETAPVAGGLFLGDYEGLTHVGNTFVPVFAQTTTRQDNPTDIMSADVSPGP